MKEQKVGEISLVGATREFFNTPPHGRKVEIAEFKALTQKDREELREMLIGVGYNVTALKVSE